MATTEKTTGRAWTFIVYEEDITEKQLLDYLENYKNPCAVSPLHKADEEVSKNHWHILLVYKGNKTPRTLYEELGNLRKKGNWLMFQKVISVSAMTRYLIHKDNPDKQQFNGKEDIKLLNGFDIEKYFTSETDENLDLIDIIDYIKKERCTFESLVYHARRNNTDWLKVITKKSFMLTQLCKSNTIKNKDILKELGVEK